MSLAGAQKPKVQGHPELTGKAQASHISEALGGSAGFPSDPAGLWPSLLLGHVGKMK